MENLPLSDDAWQQIAHLFEHDIAGRPGRPRREPREVVSGILWVLVNSEKWHHLPVHFPPSQTCYIKWLQWRRSGLMTKILVTLELEICDRPGRLFR